MRVVLLLLLVCAAAGIVRAAALDDTPWTPTPIPYVRADVPGYAVTSPSGWHPAALKAEYYEHEYVLSGPVIRHLAGLDVRLRLPPDAPATLVLRLNREGEAEPRAFVYTHAGVGETPTSNPNVQPLVKTAWPNAYTVTLQPFNLGSAYYPPGKDYFVTLHGGGYHGEVLATSDRFEIQYDPALFTGWTYALFVAGVATGVALLVSVPWALALSAVRRALQHLVLAAAGRLAAPARLLARGAAAPLRLLSPLAQSPRQCLVRLRRRDKSGPGEQA